MNDNNPNLQSWIEPELEARVVAWVLGEASEFEAAELERVAAEKPELAVFKRRIEAVHGLLGTAVKPEAEPMRLSSERRATLLKKIGAAPKAAAENIAAIPQKPRRIWQSLGVRIAVYAALLMVLASISMPTFMRARKRSASTRVLEDLRMINDSIEETAKERRLASTEDLARHLTPQPAATPQSAAPASESTDQQARFAAESSRRALAEISKNISSTGAAAGFPVQEKQPGQQSVEGGSQLAGAAGTKSLLSEADDFYNTGRHDMAFKRYEQALNIDPYNIAARKGEEKVNRAQSDYVVSAQNETRSHAMWQLDNAWQNPVRKFKSEGSGRDYYAADVQDEERYRAPMEADPAPSMPEKKDSLRRKLSFDAKSEARPQSGERVAQLEQSQMAAGAPINVPAVVTAPSQSVVARQRLAESDSQTKEKAGVATIDGANAYAGGATISAGKLVVNGVAFGVDQPASDDDGITSSLSKELAEDGNGRTAVDGFSNFGGYAAPAPASPSVTPNATPAAAISASSASSAMGRAGGGGAQATSKMLGPAARSDYLDRSSSDMTAAAKLKQEQGPQEFANNESYASPDSSRHLKRNLQTSENMGLIGDATGKEELAAVTDRDKSIHSADDLTKAGTGTLVTTSGLTKTPVLGDIPAVGGLFYNSVATGIEQTEARKSKEAPASAPAAEFEGHINYGAPIIAAKPAREKSLAEITRDELSAADQPFSTFSLHVSDVSFRLAQAALAKGETPDPESIRPEEFYNAFDYGDPAAAPGEKVTCNIEQCAHPFLQQRNLVRIAMRVPASGRGRGTPLRLTVLLDTSGSMEREDRVASLRCAMEVLASLFGPEDRVTLIGFARQPRLLLDQLPGDQAAKLVDAVASTPSEGGTNLEEALKLAGEQALKQRAKAAQNRIVLLTDGAANLGSQKPESLARMIEKLRQQGVAFDACGVGAEGLNDEILEALTRKGDGRYYFLNTPADADAGFARQLAGAFRPAAQNVKVQVRFNPARVARYRLIGFEQHRLKKEDFRNDKVDAAELAAEEAAVALYQVEVLPQGDGELGEVSVRFRDAASAEMVERSWTLSNDARAQQFDQASPSMQLAGTSALMAEKLRGGALANLVDLDALAPVVNALRGHYADQANVQALVTMFRQMQRMK